MDKHTQEKYARWFKRAVWLGIVADWVLAIPVIFAPQWVLGILGLRATADPTWTAFAGLLVLLLSLFYIPGANQPHRFRFSAWLAVFAPPRG
jgi:membrane protein YdbS with pleckstrin-like domain